MKIQVGQVFRVRHPGRTRATDGESAECYQALTRGSHGVGADINKGIWGYKRIAARRGGVQRRPAIILLSNPLKEDSIESPWVDIVDADRGFALYNGDNRQAGRNPLEARGNALLAEVASTYEDPTSRVLAPPILLFTQVDVGGTRKGYRQFAGYGIPVRFDVRAQASKTDGGYFTNLIVELALFGLEHEYELFDWSWIDARRDAGCTAEEALTLAPGAWKRWVHDGPSVIEKCRRQVTYRQVVRPAEQYARSAEDRQLLADLVKRFTPDRHAFEGFAALIAQNVIGPQCERGWVTRRSGDGGIDFVSRLDIGSEFSRSSIIVLGQAKCLPSNRAVSGRDVARVVARLQRGWLGVFVTTGVFSLAAQHELHSDKYPVMLINGARVARETRRIMNREGLTIEDLVNREKAWYDANQEPWPAEQMALFAWTRRADVRIPSRPD